jgi:hypothetical protein
VLETISEQSDVLTSVFVKMFVSLSVGSVVAPLALVFVDPLMDQLAFAMHLGVVDLAFVECTVGKNQESVTVFSLTIIVFSIVESAIGIDSVSFAMWQSSHPVSLVISTFRVDVVCVDGGIFRLDMNQLFICISLWVRLLERVPSTSLWRRGLACLTA